MNRTNRASWRQINDRHIEGETPLSDRTIEQVILINERDEAIGVEDKIRAHAVGALHRAFSVFILNSRRELLLQKRAFTKYHSAGLWSNTCCGHPRPGETIHDASSRRLKEEMGFSSELKHIFSFLYYVKLENGVIEHEYDHVFLGYFDGVPSADPTEIDDWKWTNIQVLSEHIKKHPQQYTYWFRISLDRFVEMALSEMRTKLGQV